MSIFISYASANRTAAEQVEAALKSAGTVVLLDRDQMRGGGDWRTVLLPQIASAEKFLLIWSEQAKDSVPVQIEIGRALEANTTMIIAVLDHAAIPAHLSGVQRFDIGNDGSEVAAIVEAALPLASPGVAVAHSEVRSAISTLRAKIRSQSAVYQVLYPDEEDSAEKITTLALAEGVSGAQSDERVSSIADLLRARDGRDLSVIVGHPGSGKSTTLRYLCNHLVDVPGDRELPILLKCADYNPKRHPNLPEFVYSTMRDLTSNEVAGILRSVNLALQRHVSLVIDGIDELPAGTVPPFMNSLQEYLDDPQTEVSRVVVTSRIDSFRELEDCFAGWNKYSLQPLSPDQIEEFVTRWFAGSDKSRKMLNELEEPRLAELASRPFLLALMCLVYSRGGDLGPNRSELYAKAVTYLESRKLAAVSGNTVTTRRSVLQELALRSLQLGASEIDRWLAAGIAGQVYASHGDTDLTFGDVLRRIDEASRSVGILQASLGRYSFIHRTFQEYLTARALSLAENGEGQVLEYCRLPRWEEPVRLYVGGLRTAEQQASILRKLWPINQGLTLRSLTDATQLPAGFAAELLRESIKEDRVRMLGALRASLSDADTRTRRRLVIETVEPLLTAEANSEVAYAAIELLRWVDPEDNSHVMWETFGRYARLRRKALLADDRFRFCFAEIPSGKFRMGDDGAVDAIEKPAHEVVVHAFKLGIFQVTNLAYELVTKRDPSLRNQVSDKDDDPVVDLNWFDAHLFALQVGCRLPTEAEWEYAARAGRTSDWCFGDDEHELAAYANFEGSGQAGRAWPVGSGLPNSFGLYDVHGNVWEWCEDWLAPYERTAQENPCGPAHGTLKVRRGGGHSYHARGCRSAFRWGNDPLYSYKDIGMRLVLDDRLIEAGW